jgi:hypothetical protein
MDRNLHDRLILNAKNFSMKMRSEADDNGEKTQKDDYFLKGIDLSTHEFQNLDLINWKRARALIEHENILVNSRLNWLILSQATLFSAFGVLFSILLGEESINNAAVAIPMTFISFLGIAISFNVFRSLRNADTQITAVTNWWNTYSDKTPCSATIKDSEEPEAHPPLHFWWNSEMLEFKFNIKDLRLKNIIHWLWRIESLPVYFLVFWILLLISEFIYIFINPTWIRIMEFISPNQSIRSMYVSIFLV